ncbi:MAG TPA: energy transducer TonB [Pyrinomonadaceae bacterium]|nr:energy transducer TonB [Pyrinomonadaceae bacterium]
MKFIGKSTSGACRAGYWILCFVCVLSGVGCGPAEVATSNAKATPANTSIAVKPTEPEAKPTETKPVGKEIKPADGPALKSITPTEGTILGGVLNDIAISVPKPEFPADSKEKGTVTVEIVVNEKGEVAASSVVSGPQSLWSAAGAAARKTRFDPPLKDGKPVKVAGVLTFDFGK